MNLRKILAGFTTAGLIGLTGCDRAPELQYVQDTQDTAQVRPVYQTKSISGKIIDIDEDSLAIYSDSSEGGLGVGNFEYEIFRIRDKTEKTLKLIMPHPSTYAKGDNFSGEYRVLDGRSISLNDLFWEYRANHVPRNICPGQDGVIEADGVIIR